MSLHFEFMLDCDLKPDTPQEVVGVLKHAMGIEHYNFDHLAEDSSLLEFSEWESFLGCAEDWVTAMELPGLTGSTLQLVNRRGPQGDLRQLYTFWCRCFYMDDIFYEGFFSLESWLAQYSQTQGFVGYYREELDMHPELIFFRDGEVDTKSWSERQTMLGTEIIGDYENFEVMLACDLRADLPEEILSTLRYITEAEEAQAESVLKESSFPSEAARWRGLLVSTTDEDAQAKLPGLLSSTFRLAKRHDGRGGITERYTFGCRCACSREILHEGFFALLPWLAQYSETEGFAGYCRDTSSMAPILLYFFNGGAFGRAWPFDQIHPLRQLGP